MSLTKEDLQAIAGLISESEERVTTQIMTYVESHVEKEIHQIADGHKMLYEKVDREFKSVHEDIDELKGTQAAQEFVLTRRLKQG